jgi:hypothetical protein
MSQFPEILLDPIHALLGLLVAVSEKRANKLLCNTRCEFLLNLRFFMHFLQRFIASRTKDQNGLTSGKREKTVDTLQLRQRELS